MCQPGPRQAKFAYLNNLNIVLVSSYATHPNGLCLDAGAPQAPGNTVRLQPCGTATLFHQQWSYTPNGIVYGTNDGVNTNGLCLNITNPATQGSTVVLRNNNTTANDGRSACYGNASNNNRSFLPDNNVGAGAAGAANNQLVSYLAFSNCLDVPAYNVNSLTIDIYPCKQSPDAKNLEWNQLFYMPAGGTGVIYTKPTATSRYCIVAPALNNTNLYIRLAVCPANGVPVPANMTWRVRGSDGATYAQRYRIETTGTVAGYCMTTDPANLTKQVRIAPCNGGNAQKWNAEPDLVTPRLTDISES
jgi:hypothetical protein